MNISTYYVCPTDSLFVRGNLAFGGAGEHGVSSMPPPPSLFAGAFRSALLGKDAERLNAFARADDTFLQSELGRCLGTPEEPGAFRVAWLSLAAYAGDSHAPRAFVPMPADLMRLGSDCVSLIARALPIGVSAGGLLPLRAIVNSARQDKPIGGTWLGLTGLQRHLAGDTPAGDDWVDQSRLFGRDPRLGIGLDSASRTAQEGLIYTTEGFAFSPARSGFLDTGFLVGIEGMGVDLLPAQGLLRLGGDGRSARYRRVEFRAPMLSAAVVSGGRFRLLLQTPALFEAGWLPDRVTRQGNDYVLQGDGFSARLACAANGRREVASGWDLHRWQPKPAQSIAPAGSVYWFDRFEGDAGKLAAWVQSGLWVDNLDNMQKQRRAEGYNRALLGQWN